MGEPVTGAGEPRRWLFSAPIDLLVFGATALISLLLVAIGPSSARPDGPAAPEWAWVTGVLLGDVAHVWSPASLVYPDPAERRRRPVLYAAVPAAVFAAGMALYAGGEAVFWRALA